jgi:hypothetical protein
VGPFAGAAGGIVASLIFALGHAIVITPIWGRITRGVAASVVVGATAGWAFDRLFPLADRLGTTDALALGARYGALLWLAVAPVSLVDMALRVTGFAQRYELRAVAIAVTLAISGGLVLARRIRRTRGAAIATAAATLLLICAMAGPVPIGRNGRAFGIWLVVLTASVAGGTLMAFIANRWRCLQLSTGRPIA